MRHNGHLAPGRAGLTLIELLVVMTLLVVIGSLVAIYVIPAFRDNKNVQRGVDRVATTLLIAKQRALREQRARGVRFLVQSDGTCNELQYIEQPEDYRVGTAMPLPQTPGLVQFTGTDFFGGATAGNVIDYAVQPGDTFRVEVGTPTNYLIPPAPAGVIGPNQLQLGRAINPTFNATVSWRIQRQPRPLTGEETVKLPDQVVIDLGHINTFANGAYQVSRRQVPGAAPGTFYFEVLFDPAGRVLDRAGSPIVLWVRQAEVAPTAKDANSNLLLAIYPRTGMIGSHPIDPDGPTPLTFALDGRSSGM